MGWKNNKLKQPRNGNALGGNTDAPEGRDSIAAGFLSPYKGAKPVIDRLEVKRRNSK